MTTPKVQSYASMPFVKLRDAIMEGVYPKDEQIQHLAAIRQSRAHDYLYDCMSILDTKASGLLQYDSIVLAAATLALTFFPRSTSAGTVLLAQVSVFFLIVGIMVREF